MENKKLIYLGPKFSYSYLAGKQYNSSIELIEAKDFNHIFKIFKDAEATVEAIVPIENSLAGSVQGVFFGIRDNENIYIKKELKVSIEHFLFAKNGFDISKPAIIYSHLKAIEQCSNFLGNYLNFQINLTNSTSKAAEFVSTDSDYQSAAICSGSAGAEFNLTKVFDESIQNVNFNYTRFFVLQKGLPSLKVIGNKASIIFSLMHTSGSLCNALKVFADYKIQLTKIESIPISGKDFEYMFYVDLEFESMYVFGTVLDNLAKVVKSIRLIGVYN